MQTIQPSEATFQEILQRARDVDPGVRRIVYQLTLRNIHWQAFPIADRQRILLSGLTDRNSMVRKACLDLMHQWVTSAGGIIQFLDYINIFDYVDAQKILEVYIDSSHFTEERFEYNQGNGHCCRAQFRPHSDAYWQDLTPEKAIFMRMYIEHLRLEGSFDDAETYTPSCIALSQLLQDFQNRYNQEEDDNTEAAVKLDYIMFQLLLLAPMVDIGDEMGRRALLTLTRKLSLHDSHLISAGEMLVSQDLFETHIAALVNLLRLLCNDDLECNRIVLDIISEIRVPDDVDTALDSGHEVELRSEPETIAKCLQIVKHTMEKQKKAIRDDARWIRLYRDLIQPSLLHPNPIIAQTALSCTCLFALLDREICAEQLPHLIRLIESEDGERRAKTAMVLDKRVALLKWRR